MVNGSALDFLLLLTSPMMRLMMGRNNDRGVVCALDAGLHHLYVWSVFVFSKLANAHGIHFGEANLVIGFGCSEVTMEILPLRPHSISAVPQTLDICDKCG